MNAFIIDLENRPGSLARVAEAIAEKGINITGVAGVTSGATGSITILANDEPGTRVALEGIGATYREVALISARLAHRPGSLADAARRLADAGVNIEALLPTGMDGGTVTVAFAVGDPQAATQALGELAGVGS
ncbi:MAG: ACT domain-containing protein [Candidatus Limnocylindria bacterium]